MNWKDYLKSQGYTDAEIANMETTFGGPKMAKAFEQPIADKLAAEQAAATARSEKEDFERFYNDEVLPKISTTYQDAINARTRVAALEARLKAANEYGFLSDPKVVDGVVPGAPAVATPSTPANPVPGSPAAPANFDPNNYVRADKFAEEVNNIPSMLGRLTKISNEHMSLFGSPLLDIDEIIREAQASKGKRNVGTIWEEKYKVQAKRDEIAAAKQAEHDKRIADEAVRKYASEHNMPFTAPGQVSKAPLFTPKSADDAHQPWKGAKDRKAERRQTMMEAMQGRLPAPRVQ
jgi:hypothetical protein